MEGMIKISLTVKDKKVKLTFDEARKLYNELDKLFGGRDRFEPYRDVVPIPPCYPLPINPYYIHPITCGD